jgi:hypothetical protein
MIYVLGHPFVCHLQVSSDGDVLFDCAFLNAWSVRSSLSELLCSYYLEPTIWLQNEILSV